MLNQNLQLKDVDIFLCASLKKVDINLKKTFNPPEDLFPSSIGYNLSSFTYDLETQITTMEIFHPTTRDYIKFYIPYNLIPNHIRKEVSRMIERYRELQLRAKSA